MNEKIEYIEIEKLHPFNGNPFSVRKDESYAELKESIAVDGIHEPLLVIADKTNGGYEIIAGQRRYEAANELGLIALPVTIKELNRDEAVIALVDNNMGLRKILPSEKAFGYKMKLEAMKHQGRKTDIYYDDLSKESKKSRDNVSDDISGRQVQRYIRLTELIPELRLLVDNGRIAMSPAVEMSYLSEDAQSIIYYTYCDEELTPTVGQVRRMRELENNNALTPDAIDSILGEIKSNQVAKLSIPYEQFTSVFGNKFTPLQAKSITQDALKFYAKYCRTACISPENPKPRKRSRDDGAR